MNQNQKPTARVLKLAAVVVLLGLAIGTGLVMVSCKRPTAATTKGAAKRAPDRVYATRGAIRMLSTPGKPTSLLVIEHEPINDFVNPDGTVGMASMSMPFSTEPGVSLVGLAVGDAAAFDLAVWYGPDKKTVESYSITRIEKLPAGTELHFGAAMPTLGAPSGK